MINFHLFKFIIANFFIFHFLWYLHPPYVRKKVEDRIEELEDRLANTVPNKHTQRSIDFIRAPSWQNVGMI